MSPPGASKRVWPRYLTPLFHNLKTAVGSRVLNLTESKNTERFSSGRRQMKTTQRWLVKSMLGSAHRDWASTFMFNKLQDSIVSVSLCLFGYKKGYCGPTRQTSPGGLTTTFTCDSRRSNALFLPQPHTHEYANTEKQMLTHIQLLKSHVTPLHLAQVQ